MSSRVGMERSVILLMRPIIRDATDSAHQLFSDTDWAKNVISLHSFRRIRHPGYRCGAAVGGQLALTKGLRCSGAPRIGQEAALQAFFTLRVATTSGRPHQGLRAKFSKDAG